MKDKTYHKNMNLEERELADKVADEILQEEEKKDKKLILLLLFFLIGLIFLVSSVTFAFFDFEDSTDNVIETGSVLFSYNEGSNNIEILNAFPMSDSIGKVLSGDKEYFDFNISVGFSGCEKHDHKDHKNDKHYKNHNLTYEISLIPVSGNTLSGDDIRVHLLENGKEVRINGNYVNDYSDLKDSKIRRGAKLLLSKTIDQNVVNNYVFRMWLSDDYDLTGDIKTFKCVVGVDTFQKKKGIDCVKKVLNRISKIISSALFVILMIIIALIVIYIVRIKVLANSGRLGEVRTNFYTILTQSMYPKIEAGDIIITYKNDENIYNVGDIITFVSSSNASSGITITHRIIEVSTLNGEYYYRTKGDNNNTADSAPVKADNVIGRVVFRIPKAGYIQQFLVTRTGWIVVIVLPCLGIVIYDILKIFRLAGKKKKTNNKLNSQESLEAKAKLKEVLEHEEEKE